MKSMIFRAFGRAMPHKDVLPRGGKSKAFKRLTPTQRTQVEELLAMGQDDAAIAFSLGISRGQVYALRRALVQGSSLS